MPRPVSCRGVRSPPCVRSGLPAAVRTRLAARAAGRTGPAGSGGRRSGSLLPSRLRNPLTWLLRRLTVRTSSYADRTPAIFLGRFLRRHPTHCVCGARPRGGRPYRTAHRSQRRAIPPGQRAWRWLLAHRAAAGRMEHEPRDRGPGRRQRRRGRLGCLDWLLAAERGQRDAAPAPRRAVGPAVRRPAAGLIATRRRPPCWP